MSEYILSVESICVICEEPYEGIGHNAQPVKQGDCCESCHPIVIVARLKESQEENNN